MDHERVYKAIQFAAKAHEGQKRKGKNPPPYISHPFKSASPEARAIACVDMWANMLDLKQILKKEGVDAIKLFNVDMEKKFRHWEDEIQLFTSDVNSPFLSLISEMKNILIEIQKFLKEYYEKPH